MNIKSNLLRLRFVRRPVEYTYTPEKLFRKRHWNAE